MPRNILDEIALYFGGDVPAFFKKFAGVDESLHEAKWTDYKRTLFESSSLLPELLKYMMMHEAVREHSNAKGAFKSTQTCCAILEPTRN